MKDNDILDPRKGNFVCENLAIEMSYPKTKPDIEAFLYYLYHEDVELFVDNYYDWFLLLKGKCSKLAKNGNCKIKDRQADECTQHGHEVESLEDTAKYHFRNEWELVRYLKENRPALFKKLYPETRKIAALKKAPKLKKQKQKALTPALDDDHKCSSCISCCNYLNLIIDKPTGESRLNSILWYIYREGVHVYLDVDGDWSLYLELPCLQLDKNGLCQIYDRRSSICRQFSSSHCHGNQMEDSIRESFPNDSKLLNFIAKKRKPLFKRLNTSLKKLASR